MHTLWLQAGLGIPMNMGTNTTCFDVLSTRALPGLYDQQVVHAQMSLYFHLHTQMGGGHTCAHDCLDNMS